MRFSFVQRLIRAGAALALVLGVVPSVSSANTVLGIGPVIQQTQPPFNPFLLRDISPGAIMPDAHTSSLSTVVLANGSLFLGPAGSKSAQLGTGIYEVDFSQKVNHCVYSATIGNPVDGVPPPGIIVVAPRFDNLKGVFIEILNPGATALLNDNFHLHVSC